MSAAEAEPMRLDRLLLRRRLSELERLLVVDCSSCSWLERPFLVSVRSLLGGLRTG